MAEVRTDVAKVGPESIPDVNALPLDLREQLYVRLLPQDLLARFHIDRISLLNSGNERLVRITAPDGAPWARVELRASSEDRDPVLVLDVAMSAFAVPELTFVQINDPASPRYRVDRDETGQDTMLGTLSRNVKEEVRALADGLAPGQVRRGLRLLGRVLECMDGFCRLLGREVYLVEPLFYHSAILYERQGCGYLIGRDRMEEIDADFQEGAALRCRLDDSTPFRRPGFESQVRGRSWAIHDGILGEPFSAAGVKMYRVVGRRQAISTFRGGGY